MIIAFASDAALLLWDPQRKVLCTEGRTQKVRLVKLERREEAEGADEGRVKPERGGYRPLGRVQSRYEWLVLFKTGQDACEV